jgi:S1-C subfamily serine protease
MHLKKPMMGLVIWAVTLVLAGAADASNPVKKAVVKIYSIYNAYDYHEPWQKKGSRSYNGSGCIIEGQRILTNAHVISDQTFLQVRRAGIARKYTAYVEVVAHESDLAILKVKDLSFFDGVQPLEIGELAQHRDKVAVYGFPEGGDKLSVTEGVVSRVEHQRFSHSSAYLLTCQMDASINSGSSGGPVIKDDRIVGVTFQGMNSDRYENIGYMVPAPVIKHFLEDISRDGRHDGTPDVLASMQKMENPDMRRYHQMPDDGSGALVIKVYPDSPARGLLLPGDVVLSIDGKPIENDGTIEFRSGERTYFGYLMQTKHIEDLISFEILRKGRRKTLHLKMNRPIDFGRLVPHEQYDASPTYYIAGGFVFEQLTVNYLKEYNDGRDWQYYAPTELLYYYYYGEPTVDRREVIVLVKVLADEVNVGYHDFSDVVISKVNGQVVATMVELMHAFESHKGAYHVIEDTRGFKIVLDRQKAADSHLDILERYKIAADRSDNLRAHALAQ